MTAMCWWGWGRDTSAAHPAGGDCAGLPARNRLLLLLMRHLLRLLRLLMRHLLRLLLLLMRHLLRLL